MTKAQISLYVAAVVIITVSVYLYTSSYVHAPDSAKSVEGVNNYVPSPEENIIDDNKLPPLSSTDKTASTEDSLSNTADILPNSSDYSLPNTNWRWLRTESATGTIISEPKSTVPFILKFGATDSMGSQTDCNTIGGSFIQTKDKLTFGPLMSTKMYCEGSQENEYAEQLSLVDSFTIVDNTLRLNLASDAGVMFFVKIN